MGVVSPQATPSIAMATPNTIIVFLTVHTRVIWRARCLPSSTLPFSHKGEVRRVGLAHTLGVCLGGMWQLAVLALDTSKETRVSEMCVCVCTVAEIDHPLMLSSSEFQDFV